MVFLVSQIVGGGGSFTFLLNREFADSDTIQVFDQDGMPVSGTVSVRGDGVVVDPTFVNGRIIVNYQIDDLPPIPATTLSFIDITVQDAINNPLTVPVVIRVDTLSSATAVEDEPSTAPETTQLLPNYPNPFNPATAISFDLKVTSDVTVLIYNLKGLAVRTLVEKKFTAGSHSVVWDGRDERARLVPSGLYVTRMQAGEFVQHSKMLLIK